MIETVKPLWWIMNETDETRGKGLFAVELQTGKSPAIMYWQ